MALTKEQAIANARSRRAVSVNPYKAANEKASNLDNLLNGLQTGAKQRVLGLLQLGTEAVGQSDSELYKLTQDLAKEYDDKSEGTGGAGVVGEILGDPLTYVPVVGAAAKAGSMGLKALAKAGVVYGSGAAGTGALQEGEDRLAKTGVGAAMGLATAPVIAATGKLANSRIVRDVMSDESGKLGRNVGKHTPKLSAAESVVYRSLVDDLGLDHAAAIKAVREAGTGDIPLSLPESTGSTRLLGIEKRLRQGAGAAGDIEKAFTETRAGAVARTIPATLENIGTVQSLDVAGQRASKAAKTVFSALKQKRSNLASPLYEAGYRKPAPPEALQQVMDDPLTANLFTSMQKDPRILSRLKNYPEGSIGWINEARKEASGLAGKAERSGDPTATRDYKMAADRLTNIIDTHGGSEISAANAAFKKASIPINKADESLVGVLAEMENGDVAKASQKLFAKGTTPAQIKYARRLISAVDSDAWDSMVASHLAYIGESVNHSPVKFLNAIGNKLPTGNAYQADKFSAALTREQSKALGVLTETLEKASKIRMGSDTQMNAEAAAMLDRELTGGAEQAISALSGKGNMRQMGVAAFDWVRGKVMEKRYEELARIFTGHDSKEFVDKLLKIKPSSPEAYRAILSRIGQIERTGANALMNSAAPKVVPQQEPQPVTAAPVNLSPDKAAVLERVRARRKAMEGAVDVSPQSSLSPDISADEGNTQLAYTDTTGNRTVGQGFNMDSGIAKKVWQKAGIPVPFDDVYSGKAAISPAHSEALGAASYQIAVDDAKSFLPTLGRLTPGRQQALINLSYQLGGPRLKKFDGLQTALANKEYGKAARSIIHSDYYKQTPERARRVIQQILQG